MGFKYVDLFAGIGGFRIALDRAGGECVYTSEINEKCKENYILNFGGRVFGDIKEIKETDVPYHDLISAGFPCQAFSVAGNKLGFKDPRGTLFFEAVRIALAKETKVILLENVKNLTGHDGGNTFRVMREVLERDYFVSWEVLNTSDFGLPQNRERVIVVASKTRRFDFAPVLKRKKRAKTIRDILDSESKDSLSPCDYTILDKGLWNTQKSGLVFVGYRNKPRRKSGVRPDSDHLSRSHKQPNRIYHADGIHPTIPSQESAGRFWVYDGEVVRKMSPRECLRMQGFPEEYKMSSSKAEAYKQIGNSVGVPVVQTVAEEIRSQLLT